jgi:uncharacterized protein
MATGFREKIPEYIEAEALPKEKFGHQPRLYALATQIAGAEPYDDDVLFAAVWLHDLGVFTGHRPEDLEALARWDNTAYVMRRAPEMLRGFGFPEEKIVAVVEAVRTHQPSGEPAAFEGVLIRDADILEQLGAIGVLRTVCKVGRDTRFSTFTAAVQSLRKALDTLPSQIRLESTRVLAAPKVAALRAFLEAVEAESQGALG